MKNVVSRRQMLKASAAFAALPALPAGASVRAYIGSYSSPAGPEGSKGNGQGIYLVQADSAGALSKPELFEDSMNPSWLALHPSGNYLYAANEISQFEGSSSGAVTAYAAQRATGALKRLNTVSSQGAGPAHLSVHPAGKYIFAANYFGGTFCVIPVLADGSLGAVTDIQRDMGPLGPKQAVSAPGGSFAVSGHDHSHAHMIEADPAGKFVLGADLGTDQIHVWRFNADAGKLEANGSPISVPSGDGPRHFVFHPNGRWLYTLQEEASTLILFDYDAAAGAMKLKQQISSLPPGFAGTNFTSEVRVARNGKFLYAANRLHDSIACFSIGEGGNLKFASETWTRGDYPRSFSLHPNGSYLYSCNQRSDAVTAFRVNPATGALTFTGQYLPIGTPSIIVFAV